MRPPINLKIASMMDFVRMLVSWSQRDRPASVFYFLHEGRHIYGTLISNHGYYEMYGLPFWVYTETDSAPGGRFLQYRSRPEEKVEFVDTVEPEPMTMYLPVIRLAEALSILTL